MVTTHLQGGLGNILFQISTAYSLALDNNDECIFDFDNGNFTQRNPKDYKNNILMKVKDGDIREGWNVKNTYKENGFEYDMVMICRFDVVWKRPMVFRWFSNELFYISNTYKRKIPWGWPHGAEHDEIDDIWFFSNSKNMDKFGELFDKIDEYMEDNMHSCINNMIMRIELLERKMKTL